MVKTRTTIGCVTGLLLAACGLNQNDPFHERPTVSLAEAPPPIAGGTLEVSRDGRYALVVDADLDRLLRVDLETQELVAIELPARSEPGRLVEDTSGHVYVVLRQGGGVAEVDLDGGVALRTLPTCASPRGIDFDGWRDRLHVACAGGELVTLGADRTELDRLMLEPDLRDVVVSRDSVLVSRLRTASVMRVVDGEVVLTSALPDATLTGVDDDGDETELRQTYRPGVAVRMRGAGDGAVVVHQRARVGREAVFRRASRPPSRYTYSNRAVTYEDITWRDPCGNAVVHATASFVGNDGVARRVAAPVPGGVVPVDVALSAGGQLALAFAGEPGGDFRHGPQVFQTTSALATADDDCVEATDDRSYPGQAVALAYAGEQLLVQLRAPAGLMIGDALVPLGGPSTRDTGHEVFHLDTGGGIACASCHPGGGDDGHVWEFAAVQPVRTMALQGSVGRAPYHRAGDIATFEGLMNGLAEQMAGPQLAPDALEAMRTWLGRLPPPAAGPAADHQVEQLGEQVFAQSGCVDCHQGTDGTDGLSHDVGDGRWQTPVLRGLALRAPYLHDGSAQTLEDVLDGARSGEHGDLSGASDEDVEHLLSYLQAR